MSGMRSTALAGIVGFVLTACSGAASSSTDIQSATPQETAGGPTLASTPSAPEPTTSTAGSPSTTPADPALPPLTLLESTVNGLQLRKGPTLSAAPFMLPCSQSPCTDPVVANAGWTMMAFAGPVAADGYDWYLLQLEADHPGSQYLGWSATPRSGDRWLVPADYDCPSDAPDLDAAIAIGSLALSYCYGGETLSFEGYVVQGFGCNIIGEFEPEWLAHPCANMSFISPVASSDGNGRLFLHYPAPGVTNPTVDLSAGQQVRIVGHFDDPAAATCVTEGDAVTASDAAADVARCRVRFVVTEVRVLPSG
jgi:hypothetical protein